MSTLLVGLPVDLPAQFVAIHSISSKSGSQQMKAAHSGRNIEVIGTRRGAFTQQMDCPDSIEASHRPQSAPHFPGASTSICCYNRIRSSIDFAPADLPIVDNLLAGTITGALILTVTNPLWMCKTRMCLQYEHQVGAGAAVAANQKRYTGLADCLSRCWRQEGWRGLYRGYVPGLFGTVNGAVQFAIYNWLKDGRCRQLGMARDSQLKPQDYLLFSAMSKCLSTVLTFPYQLLRTRLQDPHTSYKGTIDCLMRTWRREGPFGLYKGVLAATVKQLPLSIITYTVYEQTRYFFERLNGERR